MAPPVLIGALGLGVAAVGVGIQMKGARDAEKAGQKAQAASQQAESERKRQMELDARRRQREVIRQQVGARSLALANATSQGAGGGSGLQGGYSQIAGRTGVNMTGIDQNLEIGRNIFDANSAYSFAQGDIRSAQAYSGFGQSLFSLGGGMVQSMPQVASLTGGYGGFGQSYNSQGYRGSAGLSALY